MHYYKIFDFKKHFLFITLFIFSINQVINSQSKIVIKKPVTDTINYIYLNSVKGYHISKIIDGLNISVKPKCGNQLRCYFQGDSINWHKINNKVKITDTIIDVSWFINVDWECNRGYFQDAAFGTYIIYKATNILKINDITRTEIQKEIQLDFKVLKLSEFEIILEDLQNKSAHRKYYFQKN